MQRRSFLVSVGALSAGGAAGIGTGAFSSAEASRDVSVELADDADAYLALKPASEYAKENEDGVLELDFGTDLGEDLGEHVGEESRYFFGSGNQERNVFTAENQGTKTVEVTPGFQTLEFDEAGEETDSDDDVELIIALGTGAGQPVELGPGDSTGYYAVIVTGDNPPENVEASFEINAEEV